MRMLEPDADMSTTDQNLLEPFDDMARDSDSLRYFSNHVYVKYMSVCKRMEPPKDWVKSLVNEALGITTEKKDEFR